jgi:adenosylmethionine-8-amino-7-oxononanoate aminotransferase
LLLGIELVADRKSRAPFERSLEVARRVVDGMRARNIIITAGINSGGFGGDQIQISPPFIISEAEIDDLVGALDEVLHEVARSVASQPRRSTGRSMNPGMP